MIPGAEAGEPNLYGEIGEGLKTVWGHPLLRASAAVVSCCTTWAAGCSPPCGKLLLHEPRPGLQPGRADPPSGAVGGIASFAGAALAPPPVAALGGPGWRMAVGPGCGRPFRAFLSRWASGAPSAFGGYAWASPKLGDGFFTRLTRSTWSACGRAFTQARCLGRR